MVVRVCFTGTVEVEVDDAYLEMEKGMEDGTISDDDLAQYADDLRAEVKAALPESLTYDYIDYIENADTGVALWE